MDCDAQVASLAAGLQAAERHIRDLQDIIDGIDQREQRATALALSAQAIAEQNTARIHDVARLAALVVQPEQAAQAGAPHHHARPRDRHGLTLIRGGMAALVPLATAVRWAARCRAHKVIAWGAGLSVAVAAMASGPVMARPPGAPHPHAIVRTHHPRRRGPDLDAMLPGGAPVTAQQASRHRGDDDDAARQAQASPSPDASPTSSPTVSPSPTASPTISPSPG